MAKALELNVLGELLRTWRPKIGDWGPELPNVRRQRFAELNPQPLPPVETGRSPQIHEVAGYLMDRMLAKLDALEYQGKDQRQATVEVMSRQIGELADWCGTVPVSERIRELLKKLGHRFPPVPDPEPHPDWKSVIVTAALFADAAALAGHPALADAFDAGADKLLAVGLEMGGFA